MRLTDPVSLAGRTASSRVLFGPHETNLGLRREISPRHVAYYARRATGGAGIVVTETASVHPDDWPYERAPLAADCGPGWAATVAACRPAGALVLAGIGHTGAQGSSAWSQAALWAPSAVPDVAVREVPMAMGDAEIAALVRGFAAAARTAVAAGTDGVEVDAGAGALLRQFASGLTNTRTDGYGTDRLRLTREVLTAVRDELGPGRVLALRLSCDELAPWAGTTPAQAVDQVRELAALVDLLTVVRGSGMAPAAYRPDGHTQPGMNLELAAMVHAAAGGRTAVVLQGSVVDPATAQRALDDGVADAVEMTRAQIADADLVAKVRAGTPERVRPCVLCNQACLVRDVRNPLVSCVVDPRSGHETEDADPEGDGGRAAGAPEVLVVGGGPAGLEAARVLASHGHRVLVADPGPRPGGLLRTVAALPGRAGFAAFADWLVAECTRLGVRFSRDEVDPTAVDPAAVDPAAVDPPAVVLAPGGRPGEPSFAVGEGVRVVDAAGLLAAGDPGAVLPPGPVLVHDPVGGPVGVGVAELLAAAGRTVSITTPDRVVGARLATAGDLAPANTRLQRVGVRRETTTELRAVGGGRAVLADRWTGGLREVDCAAVVDCGHRLPADGPAGAGDAVAPRTVLEAVLEGRRAALRLVGGALDPLEPQRLM